MIPAYSKPSAMGGTLIRKVLSLFKSNGFTLPIIEPIAIAVSGGVDSMALAHLISKYGRKVVNPSLITLLHFDHQWRKESGTVEKKGIEQLAKSLGVKFESIKLAAPAQAVKKNSEDDARAKRKKIYDERVGPKKQFRYVMTGHHVDDVGETVFWRFLRGEFFENHQGVIFCDDQQLRPLLKVSKEELYAYATQEKLRYFEDATNQSTDRMRGLLRNEIFPALKAHYPALKSVLARYAEVPNREELGLATAVESLVHAKLNRNQRARLEQMLSPDSVGVRMTLSKAISVERQKRGIFIEIESAESLPKKTHKR